MIDTEIIFCPTCFVKPVHFHQKDQHWYACPCCGKSTHSYSTVDGAYRAWQALVRIDWAKV